MGPIRDALAVLGIATGIYFYYVGKSNRELMAFEAPSRVFVGEGDKYSDISVAFKGSPVKSGTISIITVAIWNGGRESIRAANILEPIVLSLDPPATHSGSDRRETNTRTHGCRAGHDPR